MNRYLSEEVLRLFGCTKQGKESTFWLTPKGLTFIFHSDTGEAFVLISSKRVMFKDVETLMTIARLTGEEIALREAEAVTA